MGQILIEHKDVQQLELRTDGGLHWNGKIVFSFTSSGKCPVDKSEMIVLIMEQILLTPDIITLNP